MKFFTPCRICDPARSFPVMELSPVFHSGYLLHDIGAIDHTECKQTMLTQSAQSMVAGLYFHEIRENEIRPEGDCRKT